MVSVAQVSCRAIPSPLSPIRPPPLHNGTNEETGMSDTIPLRCPGVGRDGGNIAALAFYFNRRVSNAEMEFLHEVMQRAAASMPALDEASAPGITKGGK
jgi:hypothetical protein